MSQLVKQTYNTARAITKSDSVDVEQINGHYPTAIQVGTAGILRVIMEDNTDVQFTLIAGQLLPITFKRVMSSTTATTLMIGLYQQ